MLNLFRPSVYGILFCLLASLAGPTSRAQTTATEQTPLDKQLARIDLGVIGIGVFNMTSTGTTTINAVPTKVTLDPGNTAGALATLRYTLSPYVGAEVNASYSRYTQNFTPFGAQPLGGVQQNAVEYSLGYVAHPPHQFFGLQPFLGGGGGAIIFRPTPGGGLGLQAQVRGSYYYAAGVETSVLSPHFGIRGQFRQTFFIAPDFYANYLAIGAHTSTIEPGFGFFIKF
jgi:hypothetical protein